MEYWLVAELDLGWVVLKALMSEQYSVQRKVGCWVAEMESLTVAKKGHFEAVS